MSWSRVMRSEDAPKSEVPSYVLREMSPAIPASPGNAFVDREAYERGFATGERAGRELGMKKVETNYQVIGNLIEELKQLKKEVLKEAERDVLQIAIGVARRVLRHELSHRPEVILGYVQEAIRKIGHPETLLVRVSPDDLSRLTAERSKLIQMIEGIRWLRIEPDPTLQPGECTLESQDRIVDTRIDNQLAVLEQELDRALDHP